MSNIKYPVINGEKECGECKQIKPISEFYKHNDFYRSYCKKCQDITIEKFRSNPNNKQKMSEYDKTHYNKEGVKEAKFKHAKQKLLDKKLKAIEYKGGKCQMCGYNKCTYALEFHHVDLSQKEKTKDYRGINRRIPFEKMKEELDLCLLLCSNCHREIHYKK